MTVLGIDHAAAVRRTNDLSQYLGELETSRRRAHDLGRADDVEAINAIIRSVSSDYQDTQAVIDLYARQESGRSVTRALSAHARERLGEQLMLAPRRPQFGVL